MILQTLLSVAFIAVIAAAIMTSALANAKVAAHQAASRIATAALARGTDEFVNWAQIYVAKHGAATTWPTTRIVDQPESACSMLVPCDYFVTNSFQVSEASVKSIGTDPITNLQDGLAENRVSGQISAFVTGSSGRVVASLSRIVTIRIFDSRPFATLVGERDSNTLASSGQSRQGETSGYLSPTHHNYHATPSPLAPAEYTDTTISITMSCSNSQANDDQNDALQDNAAPGNDSLPWGVSGGHGFEAPCTPSYSFSVSPSIPIDAVISRSNVYAVGNYKDSSWTAAQLSNFNWLP